MAPKLTFAPGTASAPVSPAHTPPEQRRQFYFQEPEETVPEEPTTSEEHIHHAASTGHSLPAPIPLHHEHVHHHNASHSRHGGPTSREERLYDNPYFSFEHARDYYTGRRSQVQGLGRPLPTYDEMQLYRAEKQRRKEHKSGHVSGTTTPRTLSRNNSYYAVGDSETANALERIQDQDTKIALTEILRALQGPQHHRLDFGHFAQSRSNSAANLKAISSSAKIQQNGSTSNGHQIANGASSLTTDTTEENNEFDEFDEDEPPNPWARFRKVMREPFAEFLGTFMLIMFGDGISLQYFLTADKNISAVQRGTYLSVSFGWGIGVMAGVYVAGGISGAHINPAVTLSLAAFRKFPWKKVIPYWIAQVLGAMTAAGFLGAVYSRAISIFEGGPNIRTAIGPNSTANLFVTFPLDYMSDQGAFFQEFIDTAILMAIILAIGDRANTPPPDGLNAIVLLFVIVGIGASLGAQTAYCVNPARDFGPRIFLAMAGYGEKIWTFRNGYFFWVPWLATLSGALAGAFAYDALIYTGPESPLNQVWEFRWTKRGKAKRLGNVAGVISGVKKNDAPNQTEEKAPARGDPIERV